MKQLVILFALVLATKSITAQSTPAATTTYISSDSRQSCYWNSTNQKFTECGTSEAFESLFTLNALETMFVHNTKDMKSSYYVKGKTYIAENEAYNYEVVSDVGNKYQFILGKDAANFVILSTGHTDSKDDYIMKFPIKKKWSD